MDEGHTQSVKTSWEEIVSLPGMRLCLDRIREDVDTSKLKAWSSLSDRGSGRSLSAWPTATVKRTSQTQEAPLSPTPAHTSLTAPHHCTASLQPLQLPSTSSSCRQHPPLWNSQAPVSLERSTYTLPRHTGGQHMAQPPCFSLSASRRKVSN